MTEILNTGE